MSRFARGFYVNMSEYTHYLLIFIIIRLLLLVSCGLMDVERTVAFENASSLLVRGILILIHIRFNNMIFNKGYRFSNSVGFIGVGKMGVNYFTNIDWDDLKPS